MRRGLVTLAAAAALTAPATATADYRPADSYPQLAGALEVARAAWPDSPCRGRELVQISPDVQHSVGSVLGYAYQSTCQVTIRSSLTGYDLCAVLTHELGHLAGRDHDTDRASIMHAPDHPGTYGPCLDLAHPEPLRLRDVRAKATTYARGMGLRIGRCTITGRHRGACAARDPLTKWSGRVTVSRFRDGLLVLER